MKFGVPKTEKCSFKCFTESTQTLNVLQVYVCEYTCIGTHRYTCVHPYMRRLSVSLSIRSCP